jgi:fructoselysine 6-kinase
MKTLAVCVGDNCIDAYLPPFERKFVGGNALNAAVHMQYAGCPTAYVGVVGADEEGRQMRALLRREEIDESFVQTYPGQTATTVVRLTPEGERQFVHEDLVPSSQFVLDPATLAFIHGHRLVHTTWQGGLEDRLVELRAPGGPLISMDYGERYEPSFVDATIGQVDYAFFSLPPEQKDEARHLARSMRLRGPKLVVVTMGKEGAWALEQGFIFQPPIPVTAVDTLGAGDTFIGTTLAHLVLGKPLVECLALAAQAASRTCTYFGAFEHSELVTLSEN